jgi:tRNA threonylcarbamoyladenosine biosynthesis protein TsaB
LSRILALDAALARCSAAVVVDAAVLAERHADGERGQAAVLAGLVGAVLAASGIPAPTLDAVAATVGPGSFTGLRAALALAHGLALAIGRPVVAVTVAEALAAALPEGHQRRVWTAIDSRRGRIFLDTGEGMRPVELAALPAARGAIAVTGDAAIAVAARLAARGDDVQLTDARLPLARWVAAAAERRLAGLLPPLDPRPLYVDAPHALPPADGLRPAPGTGAA